VDELTSMWPHPPSEIFFEMDGIMPESIMLLIFALLDRDALFRAALVSRTWLRISRDKALLRYDDCIVTNLAGERTLGTTTIRKHLAGNILSVNYLQSATGFDSCHGEAIIYVFQKVDLKNNTSSFDNAVREPTYNCKDGIVKTGTDFIETSITFYDKYKKLPCNTVLKVKCPWKLNSDGLLTVAVCEPRKILIYSPKIKQPIASLQIGKEYSLLVFHDRYVVENSTDEDFRVYDYLTQKLIFQDKRLFNNVLTPMCAIWQHEMATSSNASRNKAEIYDLKTRALLLTFATVNTSRFTAIAFNRDIVVTAESPYHNPTGISTKNETLIPVEFMKIWSRDSGDCLRLCTASSFPTKDRFSYGITSNLIADIHILNSFDIITASLWNRKIKRWQFNSRPQTSIKVLVIPAKKDANITEAYVKPCHMITFAAGKNFPTVMTSRIIKENNDMRYHIIYHHAFQPIHQSINTRSSSLISRHVLKSRKYFINIILSGYWIGNYEQLTNNYKFPEKPTELQLARPRKIVGRSVISCERKTSNGWEFCDCQKAEWVTSVGTALNEDLNI